MFRFLILLRHQNDSSKPYFFFEIVETNPFKHLCHLSLKLTEGNEKQIKLHLSKKLQKLKEERESTLQMLHSLENQLEVERKNQKQTISELEHIKCEFQSKLKETEQKLQNEMQTETNSLLQVKCDLEQQLKLQQLDAVQKETNWQQQVKDINDRKHRLEYEVK